MAYYYDKQCKCCGSTYYHKEITQEVFENALDRLDFSAEGDNETVIMHSVCNECAEEYYKGK